MTPRPWPLLPLCLTFRCLVMPFYECEAPEFVGALFGRNLNTPNEHVSHQMYTWVYVERLTVQEKFQMFYGMVFPAKLRLAL